jgi:cellulose synthase/poly-beta-1,6-N-acetylglucosamine synthase-like glycosyltransferase
MEIFNIYFSRAELYFLGGLLLTFIYQIYFYFHYINGVIHYRKKIQHHKISFLKEQPPVSVIICAKNEAENLSKFLPAILEQDYPDFEVIVINDGSVDDTDILLGTFSKKYSNLRTTFVPQEAQNLSTKKLGLTLGIKAAKNDLLLFTDADCVPASDK